MRVSGALRNSPTTTTNNNNSSSCSPMMLRSRCDGRSCSISPQITATTSRTRNSGVVQSPLALSGNSTGPYLRGSAKVVQFQQFHHHQHQHHGHYHNHNHIHHTLGDQNDGVSFALQREANSQSGETNSRRSSSRSRSNSASSLDDSSVVFDRILSEDRISVRRHRREAATKTISASRSLVSSSYQENVFQYEQTTDVNFAGLLEDIPPERSFFVNATVSSPARLTGNGGSEQDSSNTLDRTDKSDYSYSKSFDYVSDVTPTRPCPTPSMTRGSSNVGRTFSASSTSTRTNGSVCNQFRRYHVIRNSFGLDSETEDDDGDMNHQRRSMLRHFQGLSQQQSTFGRIVTLLLSFENFVASTAIGRLLFRLFSLFYCLFSSVHTFDTWLLLFVRSITRKATTLFFLWLIPFLIIFFCFGAGRYFPEDYVKIPVNIIPLPHDSSENLNSKLQQSSYFSDSLNFARDFVSGLSSWFVLEGGEVDPPLVLDRRKELKKPPTLDRHDSSEIMRTRTLDVYEPLSSDQAETEPQITSRNSSLEQSHILRMIKEELEKTRRVTDKSDADRKSKDEVDLYSRLEGLLIRLEEKVVKLENAHEALSSNIRNCCRNHSEYSEMIELQISLALRKIFADDDGSGVNDDSEADGSNNWRLSSFKNWIANRFVSKNNFEDEMARRANLGLTENMRLEIEALSKAVATAVVTKHLESYEGSTQTPSQSTTEATIETKSTLHKTHETESVSLIDETFVIGIVQNALHLYNADKTGMADFALETAGGSVVSTRCSETYQIRTAQISIFGIPLWYNNNSPRTVIQSGVQPGECWAFKGSQGYLVIQLSARIKPTAFSIEHIPRSLSTTGNIDSAPREFKVLGLQYEKDTNGVLLGKYAYNKNGEPLQFFIVQDQDVGSFHFVELQIESNHGHPDYTCLYRFRVHGVIQTV